MVALLSLLALLANLFVLKQTTLFGLSVTCSDALAVGYLLGLNLTQEFFGRALARKAVMISLLMTCSSLLLTQIHLLYLPNAYDVMHPHYRALLAPYPRLIFASLTAFALVQFFDLTFFAYLRRKTQGNLLTLRTVTTLILSQTLDTLLFSFLALYGLVENVWHVIALSLIIKGIVIACSTPFITLSRHVRDPAHL